ncbi:MAG: MFS transporter [Myxococcota bacterium]|nr:MFS transporter [Myxococcota bacterium]
MRPGLLAPAALAPPAPPPPTGTKRVERRRSLWANVAEGAMAEVFVACATGAVVTGWALHLGADATTIGALGAVPVASQVMHLPAGWWTSRVDRRRLAIVTLTLARVIWAPMALVPALSVPAEVALRMLVAITVASGVLTVVGTNAWSAWVGDLVPARIRGRFFGVRTAWLTGAGALGALGTGLLLDGSDAPGPALAIVSAVAASTGVVSGVFLAMQVDPARGERNPGDLAAFGAVLRHPQARDFLLYQLAWGAAIAPAACFWALHVLDGLALGFSFLALHGVIVAAARIATAGLWGVFVQRHGARRALALCSMGIAAMPLLWAVSTPDAWWPLLLDAVVAGVLWGGHGIASLDWPLAVSPRDRRPFFLAAFAAAAGVGFALSALAATSVVETVGAEALRTLFVVSALGRFSCGLWALRLYETAPRVALAR